MRTTSAEPDGLSAFRAEGDTNAHATAVSTGDESARASRPSVWNVAAAFALAGAIVSATSVAALREWASRPAAPPLATLAIESRPPGADVVIDGQLRGVAPLTLSLAAGEHSILLRRGSQERGGPVTLAAGSAMTQHFEFSAESGVARTARMTVVTDPPSARVSIDGEPRGTSPLSIGELAPGEHRVVVTGEFGTAERLVKAEAGESASVVFSMPKGASPAAGWLALSAPFDVRVVEAGAVVGEGRAAKIMMPVGKHQIALVNETLQFQETRTVDLSAGKTTTIRVEPPKATVSANARPWADVFVDGVNVGQTPISNLSLAIGTHDVVFRNPQLGERRQSVVVTTRGPNRIAVDMTK